MYQAISLHDETIRLHDKTNSLHDKTISGEERLGKCPCYKSSRKEYDC